MPRFADIMVLKWHKGGFGNGSKPGLTKVVVGLGWDTNRYDTGGDFDLDTAAFLLADSGKVTKTEDFVFYGNLKHPSGCAEHMGDNLTGAGEGDDEQIKFDLSLVPADVTKIAFTVTIYEAEERRQNFGQVDNAFIRIYNEATGEELLEWKFNAIGSGFQGGLAALCANFGVDVD